MDRFDSLLITIATESGGIEGLLNTFFSFLSRRTDFFQECDPGDKMGFPPGVAEKMIMGVFRHYQEKHYEKHPKKSPQDFQKKLQQKVQQQAQPQ